MIITDKDLQEKYQHAIKKTVESKSYPEEPGLKINATFNDIKKCAENVLGLAPKNKASSYSSDKQQKNLLLNSNSALERSELKKDVRQLQKRIRSRLTEIENNKADSLVATINSTDSTRRMFEANIILAGANKNSIITVHSNDGKTIHTDAGKAHEALKFFKKQQTEGVENSLPPFIGDAKPLDCPINCEEVALAASKLKKQYSLWSRQLAE